MRDSQRQKVYDAERIAFGYIIADEPDPQYDVGGIEGAQALIDAVFASQLLRERYDVIDVSPLVVHGHGGRKRGCYRHSTHQIHLPRWTQQRWYVLHEAAHALTRKVDDEPSHGMTFAKCYLDLVRVYMGRRHSDALEAAFKEKRVRFKPKRAYTITDAERERRRERARAMALGK